MGVFRLAWFVFVCRIFVFRNGVYLVSLGAVARGSPPCICIPFFGAHELFFLFFLRSVQGFLTQAVPREDLRLGVTSAQDAVAQWSVHILVF